MPDLGALKSAGAPAPIQFHPVNLGQEPPAALPADTRGLSRGQAQAALMGTVAKTLGDLPSMILGNFVAGRKVGQQIQGQNTLNGIVSGQITPPAGTSISSDGTMSYKGPGALSPLEKQEKEADIALKTQHADYYKQRAGITPGQAGTQDNPLFDVLGIPKAGTSATPGAASPVSGGVLDANGDYIPLEKPVAATSYAYKGDKYGEPNALASTIGPKGNKLDAHSLGTSQDKEAELIKAGYKFGDYVTLQTEDGPVTRRWDDRAAKWSPDGKWSVTDKGEYISKVDGKHSANLPEAERLPALTGRFDFHAGTDGKPSEYAGKRILGIVPPHRASTYVEPPLPTGGGGVLAAPSALPSGLPVAKAAPVPVAAPVVPALASDGMPVTMDAGNPNGPGAPAPDPQALAALLKPDAPGAAPVTPAGGVAPLEFRAEPSTSSAAPGALETDRASGMEFGSDGMPVALDGAWPQAAFTQGAGEPPLPWEGKPTVPPNDGPAPTAPGGPLILPDGEVNEAEAAKVAENPFGGVKVKDKGLHGGPVYRHNGMAVEVGEDGGVYGYPDKTKIGASGTIVLKKPDPAAKYGPEAKKMMVAFGVKPLDGETERDFLVRAAQAGREANRVPPAVQAPYFKWATSLQANPVVKEYYTARHQKGVVDAALSTGLTPAAALGVIDAYVKAMRGGAATQGMTHILEESQPLGQRFNLLVQKIKGTAKDNALLTPEMASDVKNIIAEIEKKSKEEVEGMMEGDKDHWGTFDVPPAAVEKTYHRIFGGKPSSLDMMGLDPSATASPGAAPTPAPAAPATGAPGASRDNPLAVASPEAYASAPKGAWVRDSSGNIGRKP